MAQMIVIYRAPKNPAAFERHYLEAHVPLARQLPGLRSLEISRGPIISLYGAVEAHLVTTLRFDALSDINAALTSECGRACAADRQQLLPQRQGRVLGDGYAAVAEVSFTGNRADQAGRVRSRQCPHPRQQIVEECHSLWRLAVLHVRTSRTTVNATSAPTSTLRTPVREAPAVELREDSCSAATRCPERLASTGMSPANRALIKTSPATVATTTASMPIDSARTMSLRVVRNQRRAA